jgi:hypothetical protein
MHGATKKVLEYVYKFGKKNIWVINLIIKEGYAILSLC